MIEDRDDSAFSFEDDPQLRTGISPDDETFDDGPVDPDFALPAMEFSDQLDDSEETEEVM